jgi:cell wall-associated NlpC family hydrolase
MATSREETAKALPSTLNHIRKSGFIHRQVAAVCSFGLLFSLAMPVDAASAASVPPNFQKKVVTAPPQRLIVSPLVKSPEVQRDGYSATTIQELEAIRAAEAAAAAEAVRLEQEKVRAQAAETATSESEIFSAVPPATSYSGAAIVAYAEQFVGVVPYGYGNDPSDSFSCDGLTQYVFGQFGISLGRGVTAQSQQGTRIPADQAQAGDLVIWPGEHVGIYDGNGGIIHSPDFGRMVTHANNLWGSYYFIRIA